MPKKPQPWEDKHRYHEKFEDHEFVATLMSYEIEEALQTTVRDKPPSDSNSYIAQLYQYPLLSRHGEWMLFMKLNYAKYRASQLRKCGEWDRYHQMMEVATQTKHHIANHNLRLVVNLAKKQYRKDMTLDEFISNGNLSLLMAIDGFDPNRKNQHGPNCNRFSTYATWSITKNYWKDHEVSDDDVPFCDYYPSDDTVITDPKSLEEPDWYVDEIEMVIAAIDSLDDRTKEVLKCRLLKGETLKDLGKRIGVCRERVRQIESVGLIQAKSIVGVELTEDEREYVRRQTYHRKTKALLA